MAIKPILFNTEMVRAILDGRKRCSRRICKDANEYVVPDMDFYNAEKRTYAVHNFADQEHTEQLSIAERTCPICPGDILYVRETWYKSPSRYMYRANYSNTEQFYTDGKEVNIKWHPSIHMPKEAARIWLKVTDVRVEQLKEITEDGALREGAQGVICDHVALGEHGCTDCMSTGWLEPPQVEFMQIWNSTIKKSDIDRYGWDANPYVFVIEFIRIDKPEEI